MTNYEYCILFLLNNFDFIAVFKVVLNLYSHFHIISLFSNNNIIIFINNNNSNQIMAN
jgi:hypothetical protein